MAEENENENENPEQKRYPFQLIEFVQSTKNGKFDCVPKHWITFDTEVGKLFAKFLNPPYNKESCQLLHALVKSSADPPESWPKYEVILKGRAETYSEAVKKVDVLNLKEYAYTTESDAPPAKKAESELKNYQKQALKENKLLLKTVMEVPKLSKPAGQPVYDDVDSESEDSSDAKQSLSSDGAEPLKKRKGVRPLKKTFKLKRPIMRPVTHQKKKQNAIQPSKRVQVIESDGDNADSVDIPVTTEPSLFGPSTSKGNCSSNTKRLVRPSYKTTHTSDSAPSPPSPNRTENSSDKRTAAIKKIGRESLHLGQPSAEESGMTDQPSHNRPIVEEDRNLLNSASNAVSKAIPQKKINNQQDDARRPEQQIGKDARVLLTAIKALSVDVQSCKTAVENMQAMLQRSKIVQGMVRDARSFFEKYNLEIPFRTVDELKLFDQKLKDDAECRKDFATSLQFLVNPENNTGRTVTAVLKKYMTRHVALNFTAVKDTAKKMAFKDTTFCSTLLDLIVQVHTDKDGAPIGEKTFYKVLGMSFANAKDWDGHRLHGPRG